MQLTKQFSVRLVNRPGRLAAVLAAMAKEKVDLLALSVMDSTDQRTLRLVPDDPALARSALETINVPFDVTDVLVAELSGRMGSLRRICERLANEQLKSDYVYCTSDKRRGNNAAIIKVNDLTKAQKVLDSPPANGRQRKKPVRRRPSRVR